MFVSALLCGFAYRVRGGLFNLGNDEIGRTIFAAVFTALAMIAHPGHWGLLVLFLTMYASLHQTKEDIANLFRPSDTGLFTAPSAARALLQCAVMGAPSALVFSGVALFGMTPALYWTAAATLAAGFLMIPAYALGWYIPSWRRGFEQGPEWGEAITGLAFGAALCL